MLETLTRKAEAAPDSVPERSSRARSLRRPGRGDSGPFDHLAQRCGQRTGPAAGRGLLTRWPRIWKEHEQSLFAVRQDGCLAGRMGTSTEYGKAARRTPTAYFTVDGRAPVTSAVPGRPGVKRLERATNYRVELTGLLGIRRLGRRGSGRAGAYTTRSAWTALEALADLAG